MELLQEFTFIALDILKQTYQNGNRSKRNRLEAWLTFLGDDHPEEILKLIQEYPEFEKLYEEVYEMQDTIDAQSQQLNEQNLQLEKYREQNARLLEELARLQTKNKQQG